MGLLPFSRQGISKRTVVRRIEEPQSTHAGWSGDDVPALRSAVWIVFGLLTLPIVFMVPLLGTLGELLSGSFWLRFIYTLFVAAMAAALALGLALPTGWALARNGLGDSWAKRMLRALVLLPLVVPPTVIGHYAAILNTFMGRFINGLFLDLFSTLMLIFALAYLAFPLAALTIEGAWRQADGELERKALELGWSLERIMVRLVTPRINVFVLPAFLLGFARALAEVAAVTFTNEYSALSFILMLLVIGCVLLVKDQVLGLSAQVLFKLSAPDLRSVRDSDDDSTDGSPAVETRDAVASHEYITSQMEQDYRRNTPRFGDTTELADEPKQKVEPLSFSGPGATWQSESNVVDAEVERHLAKERMAKQNFSSPYSRDDSQGRFGDRRAVEEPPLGPVDGPYPDTNRDSLGGRSSGRGGRSGTSRGNHRDSQDGALPESHWYEPPSEKPKPMTMEELNEFGAKTVKSPFLRIRKPKEEPKNE